MSIFDNYIKTPVNLMGAKEKVIDFTKQSKLLTDRLDSAFSSWSTIVAAGSEYLPTKPVILPIYRYAENGLFLYSVKSVTPTDGVQEIWSIYTISDYFTPTPSSTAYLDIRSSEGSSRYPIVNKDGSSIVDLSQGEYLLDAFWTDSVQGLETTQYLVLIAGYFNNQQLTVHIMEFDNSTKKLTKKQMVSVDVYSNPETVYYNWINTSTGVMINNDELVLVIPTPRDVLEGFGQKNVVKVSLSTGDVVQYLPDTFSRILPEFNIYFPVVVFSPDDNLLYFIGGYADGTRIPKLNAVEFPPVNTIISIDILSGAINTSDVVLSAVPDSNTFDIPGTDYVFSNNAINAPIYFSKDDEVIYTSGEFNPIIINKKTGESVTIEFNEKGDFSNVAATYTTFKNNKSVLMVPGNPDTFKLKGLVNPFVIPVTLATLQTSDEVLESAIPLNAAIDVQHVLNYVDSIPFTGKEIGRVKM